MSWFAPQNPGIDGIDELTPAEEAFLTSFAGGDYEDGDILYYNGNQFNRLAIGSQGHHLVVSSGLPAWAAQAGDNSPTIRQLTSADSPYTETEVEGRVIYICNCSGGDITIIPPTAVGNVAWYSANKTDSSANEVIIDPPSSQQIANDTTLVISFQNSTASYQSDNTEYILI